MINAQMSKLWQQQYIIHMLTEQHISDPCCLKQKNRSEKQPENIFKEHRGFGMLRNSLVFFSDV